eukprot:999630-Rhodomonas_salina.3
MLRICYALSGTDFQCVAPMLRICYALSCTDTGYAATRMTRGDVQLDLTFDNAANPHHVTGLRPFMATVTPFTVAVLPFMVTTLPIMVAMLLFMEATR